MSVHENDDDDRSSAQPVSNNPGPEPSGNSSPEDTLKRGEPPRPVSARKLAANRANAARSTGPRTPEGKARVAMNALRHGLASHAPLLPGEDPAELDALAEAYHDDLRPRGALERELVARIIGIAWRLRRVARAEEDMWADDEEGRVRGAQIHAAVAEAYQLPVLPGSDDGPREPTSPARFLAKQMSAWSKPSELERLAMYEQRLSRGLHAAIRELNALRKLRGEREEEEDAPRAADDIVFAQNKPTEPEELRSVNPQRVDAASPDGSTTCSEATDRAGALIAQNKPTAGPPTSVGGLGAVPGVPGDFAMPAPVDATVARPHPPSP
jgi:hypothetical protein